MSLREQYGRSWQGAPVYDCPESRRWLALPPFVPGMGGVSEVREASWHSFAGELLRPQKLASLLESPPWAEPVG